MPPELLILAQIYTKSCVGWGFAPHPTGGAYSAPNPIDPLAGLGGGAPGEREGGRRWEKDGVEEMEGRREEGRGGSPGMPKSRVGKPSPV